MLFTVFTNFNIVRLPGGRRLDQLPNRAKTLTLAIVYGGCPAATVRWSLAGNINRTQRRISRQSKTPQLTNGEPNHGLTPLNFRFLPQLALTS